MDKKDLTNRRFERLKVLRESDKSGYWVCQCDCGTLKEISGRHLKTGHTRSCGCLSLDRNRGPIYRRIHNIWGVMRVRCTNPNYHRYKDYGGRGIIVCDEWLNDSEAFYLWSLDNGYDNNLTIDRIDVDGPYSPDNCRWATQSQQDSNKRNSVLIEIDGITRTMSDWARVAGIHRNTLLARYNKGLKGYQLIEPSKRG